MLSGEQEASVGGRGEDVEAKSTVDGGQSGWLQLQPLRGVQLWWFWQRR